MRPAGLVQLVATGTDNAPPPSSEGHTYAGPIADGYWVDAADLKPGYRLLTVPVNDSAANDNAPPADYLPTAGWAEVVEVRVEQEPLTAYNLSVDDWHTYFVRGAANDDDASASSPDQQSACPGQRWPTG